MEEEGVPEKSAPDITPMAELNAAGHSVNSHKGMSARSSLMPDYRAYRIIPGSMTGGSALYPRMARSKDGEYILSYHLKSGASNAGNQTYLIRSTDLENWTGRRVFNAYADIIDDFGYANKRAYAGAYLLALANGDMLCSVSYRALGGYGGHSYRDNHNSSGILVRRSTDGGRTWDEGISIFTGFNWETQLLQLPNGDIHCYFTNSSERIVTDDWPQINNNAGVGCVISRDNGFTWTFAGDVVREERDRTGDVVLFTDQMPGVVCLNETCELVGAFEAQMAKAVFDKKDYWITMAYSGQDKEFPILFGDQVGPKDHVSKYTKGAAPYLTQFISGETVLSFNHDSYFYTRIGDECARNFALNQQAARNKGFWGYTFIDDSHRIIVLYAGNSEGSIEIAPMYLNHNITASRRSVSVDGDNSEWENTDEALFVSSNSQPQATLRCVVDTDNVYFLVEALDRNISTSDCLTITLSSPDDETLCENSLQIKLCPTGLMSSAVHEQYWKPVDLGVEVASAMDGTPNNSRDEDNGYLCEVRVPASSLACLKGGRMIVNFSISDTQADEGYVAPSSELGKWPEIIIPDPPQDRMAIKSN